MFDNHFLIQDYCFPIPGEQSDYRLRRRDELTVFGDDSGRYGVAPRTQAPNTLWGATRVVGTQYSQCYGF